MKLNKKIKIKTLSAYCLHKVFPFMSQNNRLGHSSTLRVRPSQCAPASWRLFPFYRQHTAFQPDSKQTLQTLIQHCNNTLTNGPFCLANFFNWALDKNHQNYQSVCHQNVVWPGAWRAPRWPWRSWRPATTCGRWQLSMPTGGHYLLRFGRSESA